MGLFGGEKKKGKVRYAGLVISDFKNVPYSDLVKIKLYNTNSYLEILEGHLRKYSFKLIYRGCIHPFYLGCVPTIILSKFGKADLKKFLNNLVRTNMHNISKDDERSIRELIEEIQIPDKLGVLDPNKHYVAYRCNRTFSAISIKPDSDNYVIESHVSYLVCNDETTSLYYSGVLNYLAFKAIKMGRAFIRDQFIRPLHALITAKLDFSSMIDINRQTFYKVASLSKTLHNETVNIFSGISINRERDAFKMLEENESFIELIEVIDNYIKENFGEVLIDSALDWVTTTSHK